MLAGLEVINLRRCCDGAAEYFLCCWWCLGSLLLGFSCQFSLRFSFCGRPNNLYEAANPVTVNSAVTGAGFFILHSGLLALELDNLRSLGGAVSVSVDIVCYSKAIRCKTESFCAVRRAKVQAIGGYAFDRR